MFPSPAKSESSSASNTDNKFSSTQTVNFPHPDFAYCSRRYLTQRISPAELRVGWTNPLLRNESIDEEYTDGLDPWPKPKEGYTRSLIPMVRIPFDEICDDFDEDAFNKKSYPNVEIVDMRNIPEGWVLVNGITVI